MSNARSAERAANWQGMNWIRPEKRLAIYLRDGLACVWCGVGVEEPGTILSLDHVLCYSRGGGHEASNLVTSCKRCNDSRGDRTVPVFAKAVAAYVNHGVLVSDVTKRVRAACRGSLDMVEAKAVLARRGTVRAAVEGLR